MATIANFVGYVISLVIPPLAIGILGVIGCFVAIIGRHVNSLCQITVRLLFFRISTEPPKQLLDHPFFGHTHHWSHR